MYSVKVLLLISFIVPSQSEMHSLYYMYSVISKSQMSGEVFEFYTSVELNDIQMSLCHSVNKADFMTQLCEESERLFNESDDLHYKQQWLQINLKTLMKRKNSTRDTVGDLHVLQWRHGCAVERHSNGSVMFLQGTDEYAYDGQILTFDLSNQWKPLVLDHDIIWNRESVSSLERKCVKTLTSFIDLQLEGKFIMKSQSEAYLFVKASGSSVKQLLVCLATGFYPKHVQMEIRHNQTPLPDEQLNSDGIRPNADGSFQLMKSLEILPSERSQYRCVVDRRILPEGRNREIYKDTQMFVPCRTGLTLISFAPMVHFDQVQWAPKSSLCLTLLWREKTLIRTHLPRMLCCCHRLDVADLRTFHCQTSFKTERTPVTPVRRSSSSSLFRLNQMFLPSIIRRRFPHQHSFYSTDNQTLY